MLEPLMDILVDSCYTTMTIMEKHIPANTTVEQQKQILDAIISGHVSTLTESLKAVKPEDFENKLKEYLCQTNS